MWSSRRSIRCLVAVATGSGRLAVIEGPAGIGKTRLLEAVRTNAAARHMQVLGARGSDLECEIAFGVVRQLFERRVARAGPEEELLGGVAAHTAPLFAVQSGARFDAETGPVASTSALTHGLYWLVANLAELKPLVVTVDDAQWADVASLHFLHYLATRLSELSVFVALAVKPVVSTAGMQLITRMAAEPAATVVLPRVLSSGATGALVRSLLSADADERFCHACHVVSGGNPLLLRELSVALSEEGVTGTAADAARVERLVPGAVTRHVLVRLARLPDSAASLVRAAAVLGSGAELRHAAALAGLDESTAAAALDGLVAVDILAAGRPLEFVHPLLREVLYTSWPRVSGAAGTPAPHGCCSKSAPTRSASPRNCSSANPPAPTGPWRSCVRPPARPMPAARRRARSPT